MGLPAAPTSIPSVSAFLLDLHRASRELSLRAFQEHCFERLSSVVPHDSGLAATGTVQHGAPIPHDIQLHRQPPALMESWDRVKYLDAVFAQAASSPGRVVRAVASEAFHGRQPILAHCREFSIEHVLAAIAVVERAGSYFALSLYRSDPGNPFDEDERATLELLVPHMIEGLRQAKLDELRRATQTHRPEDQAAAIVNRAGVILEAEPGFLELLGDAHAGWAGPWLPTPLAPLAEARAVERRAIGRLVFRLDPRDDLVLVHARKATVVDDLTPRELEVARLFAKGDSSQEVAAKLSITPNTVRVHLGRIYEKLDIVNKAELASMLASHT